MMKKRILIGVAAVALIIVAIFVFRLQFSKPPSKFLTAQEIKTEINEVYQNSEISEVQDVIFINDRNVFVPLLLDDGNYGSAAWTWKSSENWQLQSFDLIGSPRLWKIGDEEGYFIWNMPPDEQVAGINFYMIRDRNAWVSGGTPFYLPRIQMEHHIPYEKNGYGVYEMPKEWMKLTKQLSENEAGRTDQLFQSMFSHNELVQFGWRTVDHEGQLKDIKQDNHISGGFAYSSSPDFHFVFPLHEGEVESGK
ncbi:hypothetical protein ACFOZY_06665 [Chungangia koreensis]|uniref:Uncharacterized protein n=1 Tax=Chungangia koreensis TaxID=752657 RepID=A0ABV8X7P9_9LACT